MGPEVWNKYKEKNVQKILESFQKVYFFWILSKCQLKNTAVTSGMRMLKTTTRICSQVRSRQHGQ